MIDQVPGKRKEKSSVKLFKFNVPRHKYNKEEPKRNNPEINDPDIKYFNPESVENVLFLEKQDKI